MEHIDIFYQGEHVCQDDQLQADAHEINPCCQEAREGKEVV